MAMTSKIDKTYAIVQQSGGWGRVYQTYNSLFHAYQRPGKEFPCPLTGDGKTKFSFFKKGIDVTGGAFHRDFGAMPDGIDVIAWFEGVSKSKAMDIIIDICGGDRTVSRKSIGEVNQQRACHNVEHIEPKEAKRRAGTIKKIWSGATRIKGTIAEKYLRQRGLVGNADSWHDLYFHPSLSYKEDDSSPWIKLPGMLAVVRNKDLKPVTLHRTFLRPDGSDKADVGRKKMLLAQPRPLDGAAIYLDLPVQTPMGQLIGASEGIETGLSVREATGCPMIVGISDRIMEKLHFGDDVSTIIDWADLEPSGAGLRAANTLKEIWEPKGKQVVVEAPFFLKRDKADWNDVYCEFGAQGFDFKLAPQYQVDAGIQNRRVA